MSYVTIWLHCVWTTKYRTTIIPMSFRPYLLAHIKEYAKEKSIFLDYINAYYNHVHALINLGKDQSIAEIMHLIKGESSYWINKKSVLKYRFSWQDDYYAVSVGQSYVHNVRNYIKNQDEHHKKITWDREVERFIKIYGFERLKG